STDPFVIARSFIDELNTTTTSSGLKRSDINFILANTIELEGFIENREDGKGDVKLLTESEDAQDLRDENLADIVILFTRPVYTGLAGIVRKIKAKEDMAYCLAEIDAVESGFTGSHEIGHVIGC